MITKTTEAMQSVQLFSTAMLDAFKEAQSLTKAIDYNETALFIALASQIYSGQLPTVSSLEKQTGIPKTTVDRHLATFLKRGDLLRHRGANGYHYTFTQKWIDTISVIGPNQTHRDTFNRVVDNVSTAISRMAHI
ncbi:IclR family transcriptional regulator [Flexibacterium corallicola]|uniref:hypothetical protein n=1 Tax=Flexibacterium corallicola TaxID=3037259 RepID=UPI00286FA6FD|nr:hypothetical protein [Pseudovibrio sp. M1P-2-3]